jgi:probable rRNA maturation factor
MADSNTTDVSILLYVESRYKVNRRRIRKTVLETLTKQNIKSAVEVSLAFVGDRKMRELSKKYKGEDKTRNILSFSLQEGEPTKMPSDKLRLGDIVISYPVVIKESGELDMLVDDRIDELVAHGLMHLLGLHHE